MTSDDLRQREVRMLARACDRAGLATAYGHCSVRIDAGKFLVCAPRPMGLVTAEDEGVVVAFDGPLPEGVLGEVRMHREVYRRRPEVGSIVRFISPNVTAVAALGRAPRPRHGFGAYFSPQLPFWRNSALVRDDAAAAEVAQTMGASSGIIVSVNGAMVGGASAAQALSLAIFLEDMARIELTSLHTGEMSHGLSRDECAARAVWDGRVAERLWDYWTAEDPERLR